MKLERSGERRQEIFSFIHMNPGTHLREIQRRLSISSMGNLEYHIQILHKLRLIVERYEDGYKRYYPTRGAVKNKELLALLRQKIPRRIAILILENMRKHEHIDLISGKVVENGDPSECGMTPLDLMGELALSPSALSYYLSKMRKKGVLDKQKNGKNVFYVIRDPQEVLRIIISYRESFMDRLVNAFMEAWGL